LDEQNATYAQIKGSDDALQSVKAFYAGQELPLSDCTYIASRITMLNARKNL